MSRFASFAVFVAVLSFSYYDVQASDPELTTDFSAPPGIDGNFFKSTILANVAATPAPSNFATVTPANQGGFPALAGLGVSSAMIQYPVEALNPPHTHPRGSELLFLVEGTLDVGIVDTTNKVFTATINAGDLYVFPKGLVHFQINRGNSVAKAVVGFSSSNPGTVRLPNNLFKSGIPDYVLLKGFGIGKATLMALKNAKVN